MRKALLQWLDFWLSLIHFRGWLELLPLDSAVQVEPELSVSQFFLPL